jgi:Uma2 family endonuclease
MSSSKGNTSSRHLRNRAIAIEIVSDSNTAAQLDLKTELYFANGSSEVWVVYPKTRKVLVHLAAYDTRTVATGVLRRPV